MTDRAKNIDLLEEVAVALMPDGPVEISTMFGSPGIRVQSKIVAFLGRADRLIVKVPRARAETLIADGEAEPVTMGTRTMREWIAIPGDQDADLTRERWVAFAREALAYVRSLEP